MENEAKAFWTELPAEDQPNRQAPGRRGQARSDGREPEGAPRRHQRSEPAEAAISEIRGRDLVAGRYPTGYPP